MLDAAETLDVSITAPKSAATPVAVAPKGNSMTTTLSSVATMSPADVLALATRILSGDVAAAAVGFSALTIAGALDEGSTALVTAALNQAVDTSATEPPVAPAVRRKSAKAALANRVAALANEGDRTNRRMRASKLIAQSGDVKAKKVAKLTDEEAMAIVRLPIHEDDTLKSVLKRERTRLAAIKAAEGAAA